MLYQSHIFLGNLQRYFNLKNHKKAVLCLSALYIIAV